MQQNPERGIKDDVFITLLGKAREAALSQFSKIKTLGSEDMKYSNFTFKLLMHQDMFEICSYHKKFIYGMNEHIAISERVCRALQSLWRIKTSSYPLYPFRANLT